MTDGVFTVDNFGWALLAALIVAAVSVVLAVLLGSDDMSSIRIAQRIAQAPGDHRHHRRPRDRLPRIDGLALPVLRRAMRDGNAPNMARWRARHAPARRVGDRSLLADGCQPGGDPAGLERGHLGVPLGGEGDRDGDDVLGAAGLREIERRRGTGIGLLIDGGASRGNLLSGEAEEVILTVSRMDAEKKSNPGYRAFFANGDNATRTLVLFGWEVILEWTAASARSAGTCNLAATAAASTR